MNILYNKGSLAEGPFDNLTKIYEKSALLLCLKYGNNFG
jgi:hypothetical protein